MLSRRLIAPVIAVAAFAVAGCGAAGTKDTSSDFKGEQRQVASVIEQLEKAAGKTGIDSNKICTEIFSGPLAQRVSAQHKNKNCNEALDDSIGDVLVSGRSGLSLKVESVKIDGDKATARVLNDGGDDQITYTYGLIKGQSGWRINSF